MRGGWSVRQLDRQIDSMLYERTALTLNKAAMLEQGARAEPGDRMTPEEAIKDPFVLEFLDLEDNYSESELEARAMAMPKVAEWTRGKRIAKVVVIKDRLVNIVASG